MWDYAIINSRNWQLPNGKCMKKHVIARNEATWESPLNDPSALSTEEIPTSAPSGPPRNNRFDKQFDKLEFDEVYICRLRK